MSAHVRRERVPDPEGESTFHQPPVGSVRYSRTFRTRAQAQREADAWNSTGFWQAEVIAGRAPRRHEQPR